MSCIFRCINICTNNWTAIGSLTALDVALIRFFAAFVPQGSSCRRSSPASSKAWDLSKVRAIGTYFG